MFVYTGDRAAGNQYDVPPRYYVHGGLIFTPLSQDYLRTFGRELGSGASADLVYELFYRRHEKPETVRPEPIVLAGILAHPANANMAVRGRVLVDKVNGIRIERLEDLVRAFEETDKDQHLIEFAGRQGVECLDREAAIAANPEIFQTYGIPSDRRL